MSYRNEVTNISSSMGLLILRVVLGIVFIVHGWQKLSMWTIEGTASRFTQMGVPLVDLAAPFATYLEFIGGIALVVGLLSRLAGLLLGLEMLGAIYFSHGAAGFFVNNGGYEFPLLLVAASLAVALIGPGRLAITGAFEGRGKVGLFS